MQINGVEAVAELQLPVRGLRENLQDISKPIVLVVKHWCPVLSPWKPVH